MCVESFSEWSLRCPSPPPPFLTPSILTTPYPPFYPPPPIPPIFPEPPLPPIPLFIPFDPVIQLDPRTDPLIDPLNH